MKPIDFWQQYVGQQSPTDFMLAFRSHDVEGCVHAYLGERPMFFGIVRRLTWKDTFDAEEQHTREIVAGSLSTYIEETREEWEPALDAALTPAPAAEAATLEAEPAEEATQAEAPQPSEEASQPEVAPPEPEQGDSATPETGAEDPTEV